MRRESTNSAAAGTATAVAVEPEPGEAVPEPEVTVEIRADAVLDALEDSGQQMLAHNLEQGEWSVRGHRNHGEGGNVASADRRGPRPEPKRVIQNALDKAGGKRCGSRWRVAARSSSQNPRRLRLRALRTERGARQPSRPRTRS